MKMSFAAHINSTPKYITIGAYKFCRDDVSGYYRNSTIQRLAHRYSYEISVGPIPAGYHVHHKDEDKSNNDPSNLEALPAGEHMSLHAKINYANEDFYNAAIRNLDEIRPLASKWHGSKEGREWHKEHAIEVAANVKPKLFDCPNCGKEFWNKPQGPVTFCSNNCKSANRRKLGIDDVVSICTSCGADFKHNKYSKTESCSRSCRNRLRSRKKRKEDRTSTCLQSGS